MKKFISFILAICLIVPCAFLLAACNTTPKQLTKTDYIKVFEKVEGFCDNYFDNNTAVPQKVEITDKDFIAVENPVQAQGMFKASLALIYFMRNINQREDYTLKEGFDDAFADDGNAVYDLRFKQSYNQDASMIKVDIVADSEYGTQYFVFEIVYDFEADQISSVSVQGLSGDVRYYKLTADSLKMLSFESENYENYQQQVLSDLETIKEPARETNPEDYSQEYISAMQEAMN